MLAMTFLVACTKAAPPELDTPASPGDQVFLNHVYTVLDSETFEAIRHEPFVSDGFAATESQTTQSDGSSWTGFYLYGDVSYLELFEPEGAGEAVGDSGIGFGVETPGAIDRLATRAQADGYVIEVDDSTAEVDGEQIPWFRSAEVKGATAASPLSEWVMEYQPEYMTYGLGLAPTEPVDISRRTYLSSKFRVGQLMQRLRSVRLAMPPEDREAFAVAALLYGWTLRRDGEAIVADGPEATTIEIVGDSEKHGLVELTIGLARKPEAQREIQIGHSTLIIGPDERCGGWSDSQTKDRRDAALMVSKGITQQ